MIVATMEIRFWNPDLVQEHLVEIGLLLYCERSFGNWLNLSLLEAHDSMIHSSLLSGLWVILIAGLTCGVLDITCTLMLNRLKGVPPARLLQGIASGILGSKSFEGGNRMAALGLSIHFLIAFVAATTYFLASRQLGVLVEHAVFCGLLYGIAVHLFMSFIVLPLSRVQRPFSISAFAAQWVIHMLFVGLPISLVVRYLV